MKKEFQRDSRGLPNAGGNALTILQVPGRYEYVGLGWKQLILRRLMLAQESDVR